MTDRTEDTSITLIHHPQSVFYLHFTVVSESSQVSEQVLLQPFKSLELLLFHNAHPNMPTVLFYQIRISATTQVEPDPRNTETELRKQSLRYLYCDDAPSFLEEKCNINLLIFVVIKKLICISCS